MRMTHGTESEACCIKTYVLIAMSMYVLIDSQNELTGKNCSGLDRFKIGASI